MLLSVTVTSILGSGRTLACAGSSECSLAEQGLCQWYNISTPLGVLRW